MVTRVVFSGFSSLPPPTPPLPTVNPERQPLEVAANSDLVGPGLSDNEDLVGNGTLPHCDVNSETQVNTSTTPDFPSERHTRAAGPAMSPLAAVIFGQVASPFA